MRMRAAPLLILAASLAAAPMAPPGHAQTAPTPAPVPAPAAAAEDPLVARVEGQEVRMSDVMATASEVLPPEMRNLPPAVLQQRLPPEVIRQLTERTITERALVAAARAAGLDKDEEVRRRIRRAEEQELQQALLSREVGRVDEAAVRARYQQEMARRTGEEEVHARHILLPTEAAAREALAELRGGADFAEVAKRRSTDPGSSDGGDLGFFKKGDMVPEFGNAAFAMQPGQVSQEPVRSQFGWHIIKVEERRQAPVPSFEESRQQIQRQMIQEGVDSTVRRIRAAAKVERLDTPPAPTPGGALLENATPPAPATGGGRGTPAPTPAPQRR
jgi:peptidyl-prolyl cis-trans isomerase C